MKTLFIIFVVSGLCSLIIHFQDLEIEKDNQYIKDQEQRITELEKENSDLAVELRKWSVVDNLLLDTVPEDYDRQFNNCYQQSQRLQQTLFKEDIESSIFINKDRSHAWLGIWVDAVDGKFVKPGQYDLMEVRDINLNVICSNE